MKLILSNKDGKAYSKEIPESDEGFLYEKKIGEEIKLDKIGLDGYLGKITGGSDKQGFPMRFDLQGISRKKILTPKGIGYSGKISRTLKVKKKKKIVYADRVLTSVRGNTISKEIAQLNLKITKEGSKKLEEIFPKTEKPIEEKK